MAGEADDGSFRLTRDLGDRGPSLTERLSERLDRLSFASPFHRMRLKGRFPLKLIAVPEDPVPGDPALGQRLKGGRLFRDGYGQSMQEARLDAPDAPESWRQWVHGWGWLRDLSSAGPLTKVEVARAEALAKRWLARFHEYDEEAWSPAVTGRRILMAICYAPMVMPGHDHIHRSAVLNGVARWGRHLDRAAPRLQPGFARAEAAAGLIGCALMLPGGDERLVRAETLLAETLQQLLPEEGAANASRSPLDLARLGDLLLLLAAFHQARAQKPSALVARALEQVRTGLSALAMGDGLPSPWHGGGPDAAQMARLRAAPSEAPPSRQSGYQRLQAGATRVMVDAGPPPAVRLCGTAHASTLALTATDGARHLIVSCGGECGPQGPRGFPPELAMGLRSTAGHSALVLADTNSSRLHESGPRRLGGVEEVLVEARSTREGQWFEGRHDGWRRRFGQDHVRRLWLSPEGDDLRGEDRLEPVRGGLVRPRSAQALPFAIRFHLGPEAEATLTQDGRGALIRLPGARPGQDSAWAFRASFNHAPGVLAIEPSLFVDADGGTHEIQQLLLTSLVEPGGTADVSWSFRKQGARKN
ncbi:heparinase II/III family protein [Sandaracinobacter sp. RS1-74]|uniref:heparinase II/III family protein n=1 Tax=Sandaracinobacteroides sayramensis TaxID=2913411 RepID=UPI001EDB0A3B|nr:heparinase II/III family protein [Sandaracinobacteroides sayramensis]MCG2839574.1 heparinase II/III family protein [Sandaracinobacteroides sayramensis]